MRKRVTGRPDTLLRTGRRVCATGMSCGRRTLLRQVVDRERDHPERLQNRCEVVGAPDLGVWKMQEIRVFLGSG